MLLTVALHQVAAPLGQPSLQGFAQHSPCSVLVDVGDGFVRQDVPQSEEKPNPLSQQEEEESHRGGAADELTLCRTGRGIDRMVGVQAKGHAFDVSECDTRTSQLPGCVPL